MAPKTHAAVHTNEHDAHARGYADHEHEHEHEPGRLHCMLQEYETMNGMRHCAGVDSNDDKQQGEGPSFQLVARCSTS
ncbi:hypothetical protein E4U54_006413 [Claviceps lovelessii]|nr:hypothetical protein E4U54_006413 [Claviceps lovelessii]